MKKELKNNGVTKKKNNILSTFTVAQLLVVGFTLIIVLGAIILSLPISLKENQSLSLIDALFTSTSAVCVTGLTTITIADTFSYFGQVILMILIQIGGLGFMLFVTLLLFTIHKRMSLKSTIMFEESMNLYDSSNLIKIMNSIIIFTLFFELSGAAILSKYFIPIYGHQKGVWNALFLSVSAFCNAGIDLFGSQSLQAFSTNYVVNMVVMILIFFGGLGFIVIIDLVRRFKKCIKEKKKFKSFLRSLSLHTKIVLASSLTLIIFGALFFYILERGNVSTISNLSEMNKLLVCLFQSVTSRTAGFNTINMALTTESTKLIYTILMFIGGSPAGTAGGIKTVCFVVLILTVFSMLKNETNTVAFGKTIPAIIVRKAIVIFFLGILYILTTTMLLLTVENCSIMEAIFETVSGFGTVGTTLGLTSRLSILGKIIMIFTMFIGRVGILTIAMSMFIKPSNSSKNLVIYPEEKIILG